MVGLEMRRMTQYRAELDKDRDKLLAEKRKRQANPDVEEESGSESSEVSSSSARKKKSKKEKRKKDKKKKVRQNKKNESLLFERLFPLSPYVEK